jgi:NTE family protein
MNKKKFFTILFTFLYIISYSLPIYCEYTNQDDYAIDILWAKFKTIPKDKRPKIGLVLGGGGARGFAHVGILEVMEEAGIPIDIIVGTSVGALIGALYASGLKSNEIQTITKKIKWTDLTDFSFVSVFRLLFFERMLDTDKMESYIAKKISNKRFDELNISFACLATDIQTGESIILREGDVASAVRASAAIPGLFKPVEYKHRFLVDGGIINNIPVDVAKMLGADIIIAVNIEGDFTKQQVESIYQVIMQMSSIKNKIMDDKLLKDADYVIKPKVGDVGMLEIQRKDECFNAGLIQARKDIINIKKMIIEKSLK